MLVIGVTGRQGSGKDELVQTLAEACPGARIYSTGDLARQMAANMGLEATRENLQRISRTLLTENGRAWFAMEIVDRIERDNPPVALISGLRTPEDVALVKGRFQDVLVAGVRCGGARTRFERIRARAQTRDMLSFEDFEKSEALAEELFNIGGALESADVTLDNSGSLEQFRARIEKRIAGPRLQGNPACNAEAAKEED